MLFNMSNTAIFLKLCQAFNSYGYNDPEHFREDRTSAFKKVRRVWNESRKRSKIKVKDIMTLNLDLRTLG